MKQHNRYALWLGSGKQRRAVAKAFRTIMTGKEIVAAAQTHAPRITLRDLNPILRQLAAWRLVRCLNRDAACGRLFAPTRTGSTVFARTCGESVRSTVPLPRSLNPELLALVLRGAARHAVFDGLVRKNMAEGKDVTISELRKELRNIRPIGRNQVARALEELTVVGLVQKDKVTARECHFRLSVNGHALARFLNHKRWGH
jgi:Fe2+ or Zn2+ uptake regulation protein